MRVLIASDGSSAARGALGAALALSWPRGTRVRGVVALGRVGALVGAARVRALHARAEELRQALKARWARAEVFELHDKPAEAILAEARRFRADLIVIGWRGHGAAARLIGGSVSRSVSERAACPVLVVRRRPSRRAVSRSFALAFDGSRHARAAVRFVARLPAPAGGRVALVSVLEPLSPRRARILVARQAALRALRARGWQVDGVTSSGAPAQAILAAAKHARAQVLVLGAAGSSGIERLVLGSVASSVLNRSTLPVLIAR